jgi:hypothetical protein
VPRFLLIEVFDDEFEEVAFYTIRDEAQEESETDRFLGRFMDPDSPNFEPGFEEAFRLIVAWIENIGQNGLSQIRVRKENDAEALPPLPGLVYELDLSAPPLRLFYVRLSDQVLVLCGGGKKTSRSTQESGALMSHFRLANAIAKELAQMVQSREIRIEGKQIEGDDEEIVICLP